MTIKIVCECGHEQAIHTGWSDGWDDSWDTGCNYAEGFCQCKFFRADNLRSLEIASARKILM